MNPTDEQLIRQVSAGDMSAFDELVARYQQSVQHTVYRYVGDRDEAENLSQDIFLKIFESAGTFKGTAQFKTWLYRIVMNVCLNHIRRRLPTPSDCLAERPSGEVDPPAALLDGEKCEVVRTAMDSLPANQRMALVLHRFDGLSYKEIADVMDCPLATVESNIHRAYLALKEKLERYVSI